MSRKSKAAEFLQEGYSINITGRNVMVTDAMKDYALEKILKIERFSSRIIDVIVTMDIQKLDHRVDICLKVNHLKINSQASTEDMYASIDKAVNKIESQLRRYKTKLQEHQTERLASVDMNVNVLRPSLDDEIIDMADDYETENRLRLLDRYRPHRIVNKDTKALKTLTDGEAMMKMELSGDAFLIYQSEENRSIKVIYRRKDGDFGVVEPFTT